MRRLGRHLFTLCSAVSLLLGVAVCALWVRSYWASDWFKYQVSDVGAYRWTGYAVSSQRGTLYVSYSPFQFGTPAAAQQYARGTQAPGFSHDTYPPDHDDLSAFSGSFLGRRGFELTLERNVADTSSDGPYTYSCEHAMAPDWFIAVVLFTPAAIAFIQFRRRRARAARGLCAKCGYDLRASPDRCPECGTPALRGGTD